MRLLLRLFLVVALLAPAGDGVAGGARVKDLVMIAGAQENQLIGYGLVVGLLGEGDRNLAFTTQSILNMMQRFGISVPATTLQTKNVAAVMVTADIGPFAKPGARLDVHVSSVGDAKTLQGGVLLQTPLMGADGKVYAVAQGPLAVGGFGAGVGGPGGASVQKNHPTVAQIIGGALVEKDIPVTIVQENTVELLLREPDYTSAARLAAVINTKFTNSAQALDATSVRVLMPAIWENSPIDFIAQLESLEVVPDTPARIVINERTGTIVANSRIKISSCAVSHGNLVINIAATLDVSQPNALAPKGETVVTQRADVSATENKAVLIPLPELPTVERVASSLNALGVTPRDIMAIFQAMKQAGALQAELVIR